MDKLGLGYEELCKMNPKLIYASISGYGHTGPRRDEVSFDPVAQAMGGMTAVNGFPEQPIKCGVAIADFSTGFLPPSLLWLLTCTCKKQAKVK